VRPPTNLPCAESWSVNVDRGLALGAAITKNVLHSENLSNRQRRQLPARVNRLTKTFETKGRKIDEE
jgi:hypothetical protein